MAETDRQVSGNDKEARGLTVVQATDQMMREARDGRLNRMVLNRRNRDAYYNKQDWSGKIEGQSREFLPKVSETVEQFSAFIKRGLTQFGNFFTIDMPEDAPLNGKQMEEWLRHVLNNIPNEDMVMTTISTKISDGVKVGLLESYMVFKVHGRRFNVPFFRVSDDGKDVINEEISPWRLTPDLLRPEDYYEDPTGRGLYRIHESELDLHIIQGLAEQDPPVYDKAVVDMLISDMEQKEIDARNRKTDLEAKVTPPSFRKRVVIRECWGTLLNPNGSIAEKDVMWTIANERFLIGAPVKWPFWHGSHPFVKIPILRAPFTVHHKALYDQVVPLNIALNELFNLILDGGLASVWGVKEVRLDWLEDPSQVADGIVQGDTLALNATAVPGQSAVNQTVTGQVPNDALATYNLLDREFNSSALTNDIKLGLLPPKQVKATEVVEASQSSAVTLDSILKDIEDGLNLLIEKACKTSLQFADLMDASLFLDTLGEAKSIELKRMTPAERFAKLAVGMRCNVNGLSSTLARSRDFQKVMAILQIASGNPLLLQSFVRRYNIDKFLDHSMQLLNINPEEFKRTRDEEGQLGNELSAAQAVLGITQGGGPSGGASTGPGGESGLQSEINQQANPSEV